MSKKILRSLSSLVFVLTFCAFSGLAYAQTGTLTGTVSDAETGETIPGANILITELELGAATDMDGDYTISDIPVGTYNVNVTFVGYTAIDQEVEITAGENVVDFEMSMGAVGLDEVVVAGYAPTSRRELTGSITSVSASDIANVSLQNAESLLQGRAAGVNVISTSGNPGAGFRVAVRGNGSINAATEPLYIVDGVQISFDQQSGLTNTSPLNAINPNDIESIEVLKDASAASIYGSQAAAGVVLITTKSGAEGRTDVTFRAETGVRNLARNVNYLNRDEYLDYYSEAVALNNGIPLSNTDAVNDFRENAVPDFFSGQFGFDPDNPDQLADFNWQDFIYEEGVTQNYTMAVSGGDENTSFYLSGGYEDTDGTAFNSNFTRLNLRTNVDHQVSENFNASVRSNISRSTQFGICEDGNFVNCPTSQVMFENPFTYPFLEDGSYNPNMASGGVAQNAGAIRDEVDRNITVTQILANVAMTYNVNDWLSLRGTANVDYRNTEDERHDTRIVAVAQGGFVNFANRNVRNVSTNLVANFSQTFDEVHNFSGLVGTEYRNNYTESMITTGEGTATFFNVLGATAQPTTAAGVNSEWRLGSFFSNLKYNYDERYYASVTGRYDGHSRFGEGNRWAFFPSVSGAWRISQEDFFDVEWIDDLKLRAGYGLTGNSAIGNFAARSLYSVSSTYQGTTSIVPSQLANELLTWEEASEFNVGVDVEFLEGRITSSVDFYIKDNNELLFDRPLPSDTGFGSFTENIGSVRNTGVEFEVSSVNVSTRDFVWSSRFNIAFLDNEIRELPDGTDISPDSQFQSLKEGERIGLIQVPLWGGVNPADGRPMWLDADGELTYTPTQANDAVEYKDGFANVIGGFGNTFRWRGLELDAFFNFSFGQWAFPSTDYYFTRTPDFLGSLSAETRDRWQNPGDVTYFPRAVQGGTDFPETENYRTTVGSNSVYNASYIRLKNLSLSYQIPERYTEGLGLTSVSVFASGTNLLTFTAWPWYDPEVAFSPTDIFTNVTTASYPTERQFNAGIEVRF